MNRSLALAGAAFLLAGCGNVADLESAAGQRLPVKPLMAQQTPTAEQLLTPPVYANPDRIDELMKSSAPRLSDPFDLPPPNGGAPPVPVETTDDEVVPTGPVDP